MGDLPGDNTDLEAALLQRVVDGDDGAVGEIYDRYGKAVFGFIRHLGHSADVAADITQETFVELWRCAPRFDASRGSLRTYLFVIARRRAIDAQRRRARHQRLAERITQRDRASAATVPSAEEAAVVRGANESVLMAVQELPPPQREAILLAYVGGLTYKEVSTALGVPEGTTKSRIRLALQNLANSLADRAAAAPPPSARPGNGRSVGVEPSL